MREFMTKIADYWNERRNDPERQEDHLAAVIIGVAAVVVIVLLLLLLWGRLGKERGQAQEQTFAEAEEALTATTYEEEAPRYMAQNDGLEALRQEYLERVETLEEKVTELLATMTQSEQDMTRIIEQYRSEIVEQFRTEDTVLMEQITTLHSQISSIVQSLKETQTNLYDLIDLVQIMDQETIPLIRQQILEIRGEVDQVHTDISKLYKKVASLEREDEKLWDSIHSLDETLRDDILALQETLWDNIHSLEETLRTVLDQGMTEVNAQFDSLLEQLDLLTAQLERVENRLGQLAVQTLRYRYDAEENTLYLEPYEE